MARDKSDMASAAVPESAAAAEAVAAATAAVAAATSGAGARATIPGVIDQTRYGSRGLLRKSDQYAQETNFSAWLREHKRLVN